MARQLSNEQILEKNKIDTRPDNTIYDVMNKPNNLNTWQNVLFIVSITCNVQQLFLNVCKMNIGEWYML